MWPCSQDTFPPLGYAAIRKQFGRRHGSWNNRRELKCKLSGLNTEGGDIFFALCRRRWLRYHWGWFGAWYENDGWWRHGLMGGTSVPVPAGRLIHLPGANLMQTFAILIALYIPVGLVVGWIIAEIAGRGMGKSVKALWRLLFSWLPSWVPWVNVILPFPTYMPMPPGRIFLRWSGYEYTCLITPIF